MIPAAELRELASKLLDAVVVMDDEQEGLAVIERALSDVARRSSLAVVSYVESAGQGGLAAELRGRVLGACAGGLR